MVSVAWFGSKLDNGFFFGFFSLLFLFWFFFPPVFVCFCVGIFLLFSPLVSLFSVLF